MTLVRHSPGLPTTPWGKAAWKFGDYVDVVGRWLVAHAPALGKAYAASLTPGRPLPRLQPGWSFGREYYVDYRWLALRRGALWEFARDNGLPVPVRVPWYDGLSVDVTLGNDNSLCLYVCGSFEPNEFAFLDRFLKEGMTFIDVGANDGYFTLFGAKRVGRTGQVIAVEPSSRERVNLVRNLKLNGAGNVTVVPAALGAAPGVAELRLASDLHSGHNTLGDFAHEDVVSVRSERVDVDTLDSIAERLELQRVDFIKVDVEGAETRVVKGGRKVLASMRPLLMLEVNERPLRAQASSTAELFALLREELGYEILVFSLSTGRLQHQKDDGYVSSNVVAVPSDRVVEILRVT
jgi:FkbM family methyltransferase